jgi:stage IV sporulation protein FB
MDKKFKLFDFQGTPVTISIWFLLLLPLTGFNINIFISAFIAILVHEMAHTFVANRYGYRVYGINIGLFFGSASIDSNMAQRDSIPITAAGPISNLILFAIATFAQYFFVNDFITMFASVNLFLFIFNILPIYPMDGGHILKDFLMLNMRDRWKGARIAAIVSLVTASLLLLYCIVSGNFIMCIFSGLFIYYALKELEIVK